MWQAHACANSWLRASLCSKDNGIQLVNRDVVAECEVLLNKSVSSRTQSDIEQQHKLFEKWQLDQDNDLKKQIKNFKVELRKKEIAFRLAGLERQEEILTYFDKEQQVKNVFNNRGGFGTEYPSEIPVEPEESNFQVKFERHFKPFQKHANRPPPDNRAEANRRDVLDSLKKYMQIIEVRRQTMSQK